MTAQIPLPVETVTHAFLVERAAKWLIGTRHKVVLTERKVWMNRETPDAIGWTSGGASTLVECKVSRADFLGDRKKPFRQDPSTGMGSLRYFFTPEGLVEPAELPAGWGLLELRDGQSGKGWTKRVVVARPQVYDSTRETALLVQEMALTRIIATQHAFIPSPSGERIAKDLRLVCERTPGGKWRAVDFAGRKGVAGLRERKVDP